MLVLVLVAGFALVLVLVRVVDCSRGMLVQTVGSKTNHLHEHLHEPDAGHQIEDEHELEA